MELQPDFPSALHLKEAAGPVAVVADFGIGRVVEQGDVVLAAIGDGRREVLLGGHRAGGVIGVVQPHDLGGAGDLRGDGIQLGQPPVGLPQGHHVAFRSGEHGPHLVDRIGRVGNQGYVAGVEEAEGDVADALLRANQGQDLGIGVEGHAEAVLVPVGHGAAHFRQAVGLGIPVVGRVLGSLEEPVNNRLGRGDIRVADAEGDNVGPRGPLFRDDAGDLDEGVGFELAEAAGKFHCCYLFHSPLKTSSAGPSR